MATRLYEKEIRKMREAAIGHEHKLGFNLPDE